MCPYYSHGALLTGYGKSKKKDDEQCLQKNMFNDEVIFDFCGHDCLRDVRIWVAENPRRFMRRTK